MIEWCIAEFAEHQSPGMWMGASAPCIVLASVDQDHWSRVATFHVGSNLGRMVEWFDDSGIIQLYSGQLTSVPVPGEVNFLMIGAELLSFGEANICPGEGKCYRISNLKRGMRGTRAYKHMEGEQVMVVDAQLLFVPLQHEWIDRSVYWRFVEDGGDPTKVTPRPYIACGLRLPRLDGTRTVIHGRGKLPESAKWAERWIDDRGHVWVWIDRWVREEVEPGALVFNVRTGERFLRGGLDWVRI